MNEPLLLVERIEFNAVKVEVSKSAQPQRDKVFPQLDVDFSKLEVLVRSQLHYPDQEVGEPTHFKFVYGIKIAEPEGSGKVSPPYCVEIEAVGFFRYIGNDAHVGVERFRAVRFTGYQILYGAMREMVANITARGPSGLWHLPGRNFTSVAKAMAEKDEEERLAQIGKLEGDGATPALTNAVSLDDAAGGSGERPTNKRRRIPSKKAPDSST